MSKGEKSSSELGLRFGDGTTKPSESVFAQLVNEAWRVRDNAVIYGDTQVGCALLTDSGNIYTGCNVEQRFRSHDIHAEVNAVGSMIAGGERSIASLLVVARREQFTPCGACMDWILQFAQDNCAIGFQSEPAGQINVFQAVDLMPHYPR